MALGCLNFATLFLHEKIQLCAARRFIGAVRSSVPHAASFFAPHRAGKSWMGAACLRAIAAWHCARRTFLRHDDRRSRSDDHHHRFQRQRQRIRCERAPVVQWRDRPSRKRREHRNSTGLPEDSCHGRWQRDAAFHFVSHRHRGKKLDSHHRGQHRARNRRW